MSKCEKLNRATRGKAQWARDRQSVRQLPEQQLQRMVSRQVYREPCDGRVTVVVSFLDTVYRIDFSMSVSYRFVE